MASHSSAGVYTKELDLSQRIAAASTSIGAVVGASNMGPVGTRTLVTSIGQFISTFGTPNPAVSQMHYAALAFLRESSQLYVTRVADLTSANPALTAGAYLTVDDVTAVQPILRLTNFDAGTNTNVPMGKVDPFNTLGWNPLQPGIGNIMGFFCAINPGTWNNNIHIRISASNKLGTTAVVDPAAQLQAKFDPTAFVVEVFLNYTSTRQLPDERFVVSRDYRLDGFGHQMNIEEVINGFSNIIRYRDNPYCGPIKVYGNQSTVTGSPNAAACAEFLSGATNGGLPTNAQISMGWELYRDPEQVDVNILINANYTDVNVQAKMDDIAQTRQDCIAVLDIPYNSQQVATAIAYRRNSLNLDSSYSAMYAPHVLIQDTYNDRQIFIAPSGLVAAAYARTDHVADTWFAPAGMNRGNLNIIGVGATYNQGDRDALTDAQINMVRVLPGLGYKIWGSETMQTMASALSNVNVRRLLNFIKKSVSIASVYSVFEPHDEILRARLKDMVETFLKPIKSGRGLYNYNVECGTSNNPPEVVAAGDLHLDVYLDPVIPAKRIHLNAIVTKTGANFQEIAKARNGGQ